MKDDVIVRDATRNDLPTIVAIYNATVPTRMVTADTAPVPVESKEIWFTEHSPEFRPLWVVEHLHQVCGWLSFQSFYGRPAYQATAEVSIYLQADYRGHGLGQFMLNRAIAACPQLHIKTLLGFIFGHNAPSLGLFQRCGFESWGHLPRIAELDGVERDLVIVGKRVE